MNYYVSMRTIIFQIQEKLNYKEELILEEQNKTQKDLPQQQIFLQYFWEERMVLRIQVMFQMCCFNYK